MKGDNQSDVTNDHNYPEVGFAACSTWVAVASPSEGDGVGFSSKLTGPAGTRGRT